MSDLVAGTDLEWPMTFALNRRTSPDHADLSPPLSPPLLGGIDVGHTDLW
jgi:hypothetical protein